MTGWCLPLSLVLALNAAAQVPSPPLSAYRDRAMSRDGDIHRGKELFFGEKLGCARCHTVDGTPSKAGPDLLTAGDKFPRPDVILAGRESRNVVYYENGGQQ